MSQSVWLICPFWIFPNDQIHIGLIDSGCCFVVFKVFMNIYFENIFMEAVYSFSLLLGSCKVCHELWDVCVMWEDSQVVKVFAHSTEGPNLSPHVNTSPFLVSSTMPFLEYCYKLSKTQLPHSLCEMIIQESWGSTQGAQTVKATLLCRVTSLGNVRICIS